MLLSDGVYNTKTKTYEFDSNYKLTNNNGQYNNNCALTKTKFMKRNIGISEMYIQFDIISDQEKARKYNETLYN